MRPFRPVLIFTCVFFSIVEVVGQCDASIEVCDNIGCGKVLFDLESVSIEEGICLGDPIKLQLTLSEDATNEHITEFDYIVAFWCDGNIDTLNFNEQPASHVYSIEQSQFCDTDRKTYTPTLIGYKNCDEGLSCRTYSRSISFLYPPVALFEPEPTICIDEQFSFKDLSCNATEWYWEFGDGETSELENPVKQFNSPGNYNVCLRVENSCGEDEYCQTVAVVDYPVVDFTTTPSNNQICLNETIQLNNQSNGWSNIIWEINPLDTPDAFIFTDTLMTLTSDYLQLQFFQTGVYDVKLTAFNVCDEKIKETQIEVFEDPIIELEPIDDQCSESLAVTPVLNTEENLDDDKIKWTFTGGSPASATGLDPGLIEFQASNNINEVIVTVETECGITTKNETFYLIDPTKKIDFENIETCKSDDPFSLDSLVRDGNWSSDDCLNGADIFNPDCDKDTVVVVFTGDCDTESELNIIIKDTQPIEITPYQEICSNLSTYQIDFSPTGGIWSGEEAIDSLNGIINPSELGNGIFIYTYSFDDTENGCSSDTVVQVTITDLNAEIENFNPTYCLINEDFQLEASPEGGEWIGLNNQNGILNPAEIGIDTLQIIYQYSDSSGCSDADTVRVEIIEAPVIQNIPNLVFCCNDDAYDIQAENPITPLGGTFSGSDGISKEGLFTPSNVCDEGRAEITYRFSTGDINCAVDTTFIIEVKPNPGLPEISNDVICLNETPVNLSEQYPDIDFWQGDSITDSLLGIFQPIVAGSFDIEYGILDEQKSCTAKTTLTVEGIPDFEPDFNNIICQDETIDFQLDSTEEQTNFTMPGSYNISLTVTTPSGCNNTINSDLYVIASPSGSFQLNINKTDTCAPVDLAYNFTATGDSLNYFWDFGDGETSDLRNPEHTYGEGIETDTTLYLSLSVWNICDSISFLDSVKVAPKPKVDFGPNVDDICSGTPIAFNNASTGNPTSFHWDFGNGDTSNVFLPDSITFYTNDIDTTYNVVLTIENGCGVDTASRNIVVQPNTVIAFFRPNTLKDCAPLTVKFEDISTDGDFLYWNFGDGNISNEENPSYTFVNPGIYNVMLSANNGCGYDTAYGEIEVIELPKIDRIEIDDSQPCADLALNFSYLTNDSISNVIWSFGDGDTSKLTAPIHVYDTAGLYNLNIEYTSSTTGCVNTLDTLLEIIEALPIIDAIPDTLSGCEPFNLRITENIIGANTFYWDLGNGNTQNEETLTRTLDTAGMYSIWLFGRNDCGTDSAKYMVEVFPKPAIENLRYTNVSNCVNDLFGFEFDTSEILSSTTWDFGDGNESTDRSPTHQYQLAGTYTVSLTIESPQFNCDNTQEFVVEVFPKPSYFLDTLNNECANTPINFDLTGALGTYFLWDFGDGQTAVEQNPDHIYYTNQDTTYNIEVVITNDTGCTDSVQSNIKIYGLPDALLEIEDFNKCDLNKSINFQASSNDEVSYFWDFGNGQTANISNPSTTYPNAGEFNVLLIAENTFGCKHTADTIIELFEPPTASFAEVEQEGCLPYEVTLVNLSENISNITWQIGDTIIEGEQVLNYHFNELGQYDIEVTVEFDEQCFDTLKLENYFSIYPNPDASFTFDSSSVDLGSEIQFYNTTIGVSLFDWSFGDKETSALENPTHTYYYNGNYEVVLQTTNEFGCADTASAIIEINRDYVLNVPNALIPSDPNNEVKIFLPKGVGLVEYELRIYSKWGNLIWRTDELSNGKPYKGWDGLDLEGRAVEQGSYLWEINIKN